MDFLIRSSNMHGAAAWDGRSSRGRGWRRRSAGFTCWMKKETWEPWIRPFYASAVLSLVFGGNKAADLCWISIGTCGKWGFLQARRTRLTHQGSVFLPCCFTLHLLPFPEGAWGSGLASREQSHLCHESSAAALALQIEASHSACLSEEHGGLHRPQLGNDREEKMSFHLV